MGRDEVFDADELGRSNGVSRRDFLKLTSGAVVLGAGGSALAVRGSSLSGTTTTSWKDTPAKIPRGGTLNVALTGGDSSDTIDGQQGVNNVDFARIVSLYDALVVWNLNCHPELTLARRSSRTPTSPLDDQAANGHRFHNGKPLTADDVIYSYQRVVAGNHGGASSVAPCDVKNMRAVNNLTVQIPCHVPFADVRRPRSSATTTT